MVPAPSHSTLVSGLGGPASQPMLLWAQDPNFAPPNQKLKTCALKTVHERRKGRTKSSKGGMGLSLLSKIAVAMEPGSHPAHKCLESACIT